MTIDSGPLWVLLVPLRGPDAEPKPVIVVRVLTAGAAVMRKKAPWFWPASAS